MRAFYTIDPYDAFDAIDPYEVFDTTESYEAFDANELYEVFDAIDQSCYNEVYLYFVILLRGPVSIRDPP